MNYYHAEVASHRLIVNVGPGSPRMMVATVRMADDPRWGEVLAQVERPVGGAEEDLVVAAVVEAAGARWPGRLAAISGPHPVGAMN